MPRRREFAKAVVSVGVRLGMPATVLCDGDPGLSKLQRQVMPKATLVLDWFHIAMRFEHALHAALGLGAGISSAYLRVHPIRDLASAKWKLWHGRSCACLGRLAYLAHRFDAAHIRDVRGAAAARRDVNVLIEYLHVNRLALVNYGRRRHDGLTGPLSALRPGATPLPASRRGATPLPAWRPSATLSHHPGYCSA